MDKEYWQKFYNNSNVILNNSSDFSNFVIEYFKNYKLIMF